MTMKFFASAIEWSTSDRLPLGRVDSEPLSQKSGFFDWNGQSNLPPSTSVRVERQGMLEKKTLKVRPKTNNSFLTNRSSRTHCVDSIRLSPPFLQHLPVFALAPISHSLFASYFPIHSRLLSLPNSPSLSISRNLQSIKTTHSCLSINLSMNPSSPSNFSSFNYYNCLLNLIGDFPFSLPLSVIFTAPESYLHFNDLFVSLNSPLMLAFIN